MGSMLDMSFFFERQSRVEQSLWWGSLAMHM